MDRCTTVLATTRRRDRGRWFPVEPDSVLVRECLAGSRHAFAQLARRYERRVFAIAYALLLDPHEAEDALQQTLLIAYERLGTLRRPDSFAAWVSRIADRTARHRLYHMKREVPTDIAATMQDRPTSHVEQAAFERKEDLRRLATSALASLPTSLRTPLVMRCMYDSSYEDIAESLAISANAAEIRVRRARVVMRSYFARWNLEEECLDILRSHCIALPIGLQAVDAVVNAIHGKPAPSTGASQSAGYGWGIAGAAAVLTLVGAMAFPQPAQEVAPSPEGTRTMQVRLLGDIKREAVIATPTPGKIAKPREIIKPGEEHFGWTPLNPRVDPTSVGFQSQHFASAPGGAVVQNDHSVAKHFDPVTGTVTLELWLKPAEGRANTSVGFLSGNVIDAPGITFVIRDDSGVWRYVRSGVPVPLPRVLDAARFRIVYRTEAAAYDLYVDGALIDEWIPAISREQMDRLNQPVNGVVLASGWNRIGHPAYFDDMRLDVKPTGSLRPVVFEPYPQDPEESLRLVAGSINGAPVPTDRVLLVRPTEAVEGWLDLDVTNTSGPNGDYYVVTVPGWGDRTRNYASVAKVPPGTHRVRAPVRFDAPDREGEYYFWTVGGAQTEAMFIASTTSWVNGEPVWGDGNDVA
ncbi:sigma-70 family RNA polymerase sigma factor, partial [Candidatus Poribacteria bacterium]|nr:sigma-70 family RNA polymerase sigma factor [Candidatus Poribacteria bacterium]